MAWKNFQNGYPLYASELNNYLMNQAVATFASASERSSVLTSPVEGQVTWVQDTNAFQVYNGSAWVDINDNTDAIQKSLLTTQGDLIVRNGTEPARLGIGTNGQVLTSNGTTATWATPGGGGGVELISTTTLSGTTVTLSSIPQTFKNIYLILNNVTFATADATVRVRVNSANTGMHYRVDDALTPGNYYNTFQYVDSNCEQPMKYTGGDNVWELQFTNYASTTARKIYKSTFNGMSDATYRKCASHFGGFNSTTAISSFQIVNSGNYAFNGGTALLYGVK